MSTMLGAMPYVFYTCALMVGAYVLKHYHYINTSALHTL